MARRDSLPTYYSKRISSWSSSKAPFNAVLLLHLDVASQGRFNNVLRYLCPPDIAIYACRGRDNTRRRQRRPASTGSFHVQARRGVKLLRQQRSLPHAGGRGYAACRLSFLASSSIGCAASMLFSFLLRSLSGMLTDTVEIESTEEYDTFERFETLEYWD